jgi:hypothetical protein
MLTCPTITASVSFRTVAKIFYGTQVATVTRVDPPLTAAGTQVAINAGGGNDLVTVGAGNLDVLAGPVAVNGQAGTDTVVLNDQNLLFGDAYTVTGISVTRPFFGGFFYSTPGGRDPQCRGWR